MFFSRKPTLLPLLDITPSTRTNPTDANRNIRLRDMMIEKTKQYQCRDRDERAMRDQEMGSIWKSMDGLLEEKHQYETKLIGIEHSLKSLASQRETVTIAIAEWREHTQAQLIELAQQTRASERTVVEKKNQQHLAEKTLDLISECKRRVQSEVRFCGEQLSEEESKSVQIYLVHLNAHLCALAPLIGFYSRRINAAAHILEKAEQTWIEARAMGLPTPEQDVFYSDLMETDQKTLTSLTSDVHSLVTRTLILVDTATQEFQDFLNQLDEDAIEALPLQDFTRHMHTQIQTSNVHNRAISMDDSLVYNGTEPQTIPPVYRHSDELPQTNHNHVFQQNHAPQHNYISQQNYVNDQNHMSNGQSHVANQPSHTTEPSHTDAVYHTTQVLEATNNNSAAENVINATNHSINAANSASKDGQNATSKDGQFDRVTSPPIVMNGTTESESQNGAAEAPQSEPVQHPSGSHKRQNSVSSQRSTGSSRSGRRSGGPRNTQQRRARANSRTSSESGGRSSGARDSGDRQSKQHQQPAGGGKGGRGGRRNRFEGKSQPAQHRQEMNAPVSVSAPVSELDFPTLPSSPARMSNPASQPTSPTTAWGAAANGGGSAAQVVARRKPPMRRITFGGPMQNGFRPATQTGKIIYMLTMWEPYAA
eukprot:328060_1